MFQIKFNPRLETSKDSKFLINEPILQEKRLKKRNVRAISPPTPSNIYTDIITMYEGKFGSINADNDIHLSFPGINRKNRHS